MDKLAYLAGAMRDGSFIKNNNERIYRLVIYQRNEKWIRKVSEFIYELFGAKPTISQDSRGLWRATLNSKQIYNTVVRLLEFDGEQASWNTPNFVLRGSSATKRAYISGFFDAEGSINSLDKYGANYFKPKDIRIYFAQANKRVLEELKSMIESFGIKCGNVVGPYVKKGTSTKMYGLIIHGREQCSNFYKTFYVYHPDKKEGSYFCHLGRQRQFGSIS